MPGFEAGEVEQFIDQHEELHAVAMDGVDVIHLAAVQRPAAFIIEQQLAEADDAVERRAQVVADLGEEFGLALIDLFEALLVQRQPLGLGKEFDVAFEDVKKERVSRCGHEWGAGRWCARRPLATRGSWTMWVDASVSRSEKSRLG